MVISILEGPWSLEAKGKRYLRCQGSPSGQAQARLCAINVEGSQIHLQFPGNKAAGEIPVQG